MNKPLLIAAVFAAAALSIWAAREITSHDDASLTAGGKPDGIMPGFVLAEGRPEAPSSTLLGPDGETTLAALRGQVLLVNFWAEWCAPCREEMPTLAALNAALGGADFRVVPISADRAPPEDAQKKLEDFGGAGLRTLSDPGMALMGELGILGLPTTILFDREGREIGRLTGPADWNGSDARRLVERAIGEAL